MKNLRTCIALSGFASAIFFPGCTSPHRVLHCVGSETLPTEKQDVTFCIDRGTCQDTTPAKWCAYNLLADEDEFAKYNVNVNGWYSEWQGGCSVDDPPPGAIAGDAPTSCNPGGGEGGGGGGGGGATGDSTQTTGESSTSETTTPTSGESDSATTGEEEIKWLCSRYSPTNCQAQIGGDNVPGPPCWTEAPFESVCIFGTEAKAIEFCQADCLARDSSLLDRCNDENEPGNSCSIDDQGEVNDHGKMDCNLTDENNEGPVPVSEYLTWTCVPGTPMKLSQGAPLHPFQATGGVVFSDGTSASVQDIRGYIGYSTSNCVSGVCDFTIDALEGFRADFSGYYTDASGAVGTYDLNGADFQLVSAVVRGKWYSSRGTIVVSSSLLDAAFWLEDGVIDSTPLPMTTFPVMAIDQIVGSLRPGGALTLNLSYTWDGGVVYISLTTHS